jgi:hypothetical protein
MTVTGGPLSTQSVRGAKAVILAQHNIWFEKIDPMLLKLQL